MLPFLAVYYYFIFDTFWNISISTNYRAGYYIIYEYINTFWTQGYSKTNELIIRCQESREIRTHSNYIGLHYSSNTDIKLSIVLDKIINTTVQDN